ncbi:MAG: hypothetical protein WC773_03490 [Patescibacteria group bacterium]|jgi:hypothetical protein
MDEVSGVVKGIDPTMGHIAVDVLDEGIRHVVRAKVRDKVSEGDPVVVTRARGTEIITSVRLANSGVSR